MASDKIISIVSSELKTSKTGKQYLEVIDQDNVKYSCWDESLWNVLGKNGNAKMEFEQKGIFKNIVAAESITAEDIKKTPPQAERFEPQEIGMWYKEMGECIRSGQLEKDFPKSFVKIKTQYYKRMSLVTDTPFWKERED